VKKLLKNSKGDKELVCKSSS